MAPTTRLHTRIRVRSLFVLSLENMAVSRDESFFSDRRSAAPAEEDVEGTFRQNLHVEPERPGVDVLEIHLDPLIEVFRLAVDVPEADHPRRHAELPPLPVLEVLPFLGGHRPWADQAHVPLQDAPELGKLVEAEFPQESSHRRDPWIIGHLEDGACHLVALEERRLQLVGLDDHAAELVADERPAVSPG